MCTGKSVTLMPPVWPDNVPLMKLQDEKVKFHCHQEEGGGFPFFLSPLISPIRFFLFSCWFHSPIAVLFERHARMYTGARARL